MASSRFVLLALLPSIASAWPGSYSCAWTCMNGLAPGGSFNKMGIATFGATTGNNCVITSNVPAAGFTSGASYTITVTSTTALARKVASDRAGFGGQNVHDSSSKVLSSTHTWVGASDATASFRALCGSGGNVDQMWVASVVTVNKATTTAVATTAVATAVATTTAVAKGPTTTAVATTAAAATTAATSVTKKATTAAPLVSTSAASPGALGCLLWSVVVGVFGGSMY